MRKLLIGDFMLWIITKVLIIYFSLIVVFRLLGKREVGELSIFDLIILLIIADIASLGIDNNSFFLPSLICLSVLVVLQKILSILTLKNSKIRDLVDGKPTIICYDGNLNLKNMKHELYSVDDLVSQMHENHIQSISEIRLAILETNGSLSIFRADRFDHVVLPIIISGDYNQENLKTLKIEKSNIDNFLKSINIKTKNIMFASYQNGKIELYYKKHKKEEVLKPHILELPPNIIGLS